MRSYDLSPLFRSTVGFDRVTRLLEAAMNGEDNGSAYPPYNIEKLGDDNYRISMAVAGFAIDDIDITAHPNLLIVQGKAKEQEGGTFLHRGIAGRAFERRFQLADHIRVTEANLENGLLHISLVREVPETLKPRTIPIIANVAQKAVPAPVAA
ncbi:Hsp20 family protein [Niveispirillum sp. SYP-B3756]|jgi:molecular chaperone IbpA|uniref:Hsp20 family protein n=1 Tax=Azospirillaceae TaxID=2829815 RepID=UPI000B6D49AF|nr:MULTISPECIES: Hsp20 family protein [Azospirillaceae]MDG5494252.1 Hsp20 family protein [Niveispirillum sp. BGYR6]MQP65436.1 Hsp20 family protein [Niveispirillum sp. SYP-B3756]SNR98618.1 molecular chaperone IbpA [Azospirillum sp. RU38E]SNS15968.1 molecular chaperone IbpA [Azospirillum sp. RU37A]